MKTAIDHVIVIARSAGVESHSNELRMFLLAGLKASKQGDKIHVALNHGYSAVVELEGEGDESSVVIDFGEHDEGPVELYGDLASEKAIELLIECNKWPTHLQVGKVKIPRCNALEYEVVEDGFKIIAGLRFDKPFFRCNITDASSIFPGQRQGFAVGHSIPGTGAKIDEGSPMLSTPELVEMVKAAARNGVQSFDHTPKTHPQYKLKDAMEAFAKKLGA
jgi:hypothetical protein